MLLGVVTLIVVGCGQNPPPELPPPPKKEAVVAPALPEQYIDRRRLEVVLQQGPGWLLERVPIEEVLRGKDFVGWRVRELPIEFKDIELRAGDVVTRVNAMPIQTPADFWAAWTTLTVASELKIAYVREGEERELSLPILGSPNPAVAKDLERQQGAPPPAAPAHQRPKRHETIVIEPHEKPSTDTRVDYSE